jgi:hypothetical protein
MPEPAFRVRDFSRGLVVVGSARETDGEGIMGRWGQAVALAAMILASAFGHDARADAGQFTGEWRNLDTTARGVVHVGVVFEGDRVRVRAYSYCQPDPCDLGWATGYAYAGSASSNIAESADAVSVMFRERYAERLLILWPYEQNRLKAELLTRFTDGSARTNTREVYILSRTSDRVAGLPGGGATGEDCVGFDPQGVRVQRFAGTQWKVVDGAKALLDFGASRDNAFRAHDIIKHYGLSRQCWLGRPRPAMQYYLAGTEAPAGWLQGEDCVAFAPERLAVRRLDDRWVVGESDSVLVDAGQNRGEAERALGIIKRHAFSNLCYVGRPNPPMVYFRR